MVKALSNKTAGNRAIDEFKHRYRSGRRCCSTTSSSSPAGPCRSSSTFNALFEGKQQIILTCDRYPKEVENFRG